MRLVAGEPNATYVTINLGEIYIADNIKEQSFGLDGRRYWTQTAAYFTRNLPETV